MTGIIQTHRWPATGKSPQQERGVYLLHGIGEHAGRYEQFASHLADLGYNVAAHDHPGHGKSSGKRGVINHDNELVDTAIEQFQAFALESGSTPILFGHSLGGLVATSMVLEKQLKVAGLILSAPAYAPFIGPVNKMKLKMLETIAPRFAQQLPYNAALLTHDKDQQAQGKNDPLNHRYKSASIVGWIVRAGQQVIQAASTLEVSTLILIPGADAVIDSSQTQIFIDHAPSELITTHTYADFLHELLNETPDRRGQVLEDIDHWLDQLS